MEIIYDIPRFFPQHLIDPQIETYLNHHTSHLLKCVENELYPSAYYHLHILYMVFVYLQILRISKEKGTEFEYCWIGFPSQEKEFLNEPSSPFPFSKINEKTVFRFFRLVGFDDGTIGNISAVVTERNKRLHATGKIFFETTEEFQATVYDYEMKMEKILEKQFDFLNGIYQQLIQLFDAGYEITEDDIEAQFIDAFYFSDKEFEILIDGKTDMVSNYLRDDHLS